MKQLTPLEQAILQTLAFFDLYGRPLRFSEIHIFLWKYQISESELEKTLSHTSTISIQDDWYVLPGREAIIKEHVLRKEREEFLWSKARRYLRFLNYLPFIRMVAVCNTLAFSATEPKSDIDLFCIIQEGRLWMTRFLITGLLHILGVRRYGHKISGRFCLSFFATEKGLDLGNIALPEDVYLTYWMATLIPMIDEQGHDIFLQKNLSFIKEFLPQFGTISQKNLLVQPSLSRPWFSKPVQSFLQFLFQGWFGDKCEAMIRYFLYRRSQKKAQLLDQKANVVISDTLLKFHNIDRRAEISGAWKKRCQEIL